MPLPAFLEKVLDWLHAGYPKGIPQQDYYPLLAFLTRRLTSDEIVEVVSAVQSDGDPGTQPTSDEVRKAIETVTNSPVTEDDVRRIEKRLQDVGWTPPDDVES